MADRSARKKEKKEKRKIELQNLRDELTASKDSGLSVKKQLAKSKVKVGQLLGQLADAKEVIATKEHEFEVLKRVGNGVFAANERLKIDLLAARKSAEKRQRTSKVLVLRNGTGNGTIWATVLGDHRFIPT